MGSKPLDYSDVEEFVINYIDRNGEPCTWIGTESGLASSEKDYQIKMIIKIPKNE